MGIISQQLSPLCTHAMRCATNTKQCAPQYMHMQLQIFQWSACLYGIAAAAVGNSSLYMCANVMVLLAMLVVV